MTRSASENTTTPNESPKGGKLPVPTRRNTYQATQLEGNQSLSSCAVYASPYFCPVSDSPPLRPINLGVLYQIMAEEGAPISECLYGGSLRLRVVEAMEAMPGASPDAVLHAVRSGLRARPYKWQK
eukprot:GEMP01043808.1.p1 GENE.GEMP01043808.1~~GEMP01043808.1.p1  ORF type:complete len:126 (+),score=26.15 GEMP01043808.1:57-434(+)